MKSKKGAEFTIGMLIALILGLIVLVVIALGFTYGWSNLKQLLLKLSIQVSKQLTSLL